MQTNYGSILWIQCYIFFFWILTERIVYNIRIKLTKLVIRLIDVFILSVSTGYKTYP